jgi:hypothetical protein
MVELSLNMEAHIQLHIYLLLPTSDSSHHSQSPIFDAVSTWHTKVAESETEQLFDTHTIVLNPLNPHLLSLRPNYYSEAFRFQYYEIGKNIPTISVSVCHLFLCISTTKKTTNSMVFSPQANYTD